MNIKNEKNFFIKLVLSLLPLIFLGNMGVSLVFCSSLFTSAFLSGRKRLAVSGSIAVFLAAFISLGFNFLLAVVFLATTLLLAEIIYISFFPGGKFTNVLVLGSGVCLISSVFNTYIMARIYGVSPIKVLFEQPLSQAIEAAGGMEGINADMVNMMSASMAELTATFEKIAPSVLILTAALTAFAAYLISARAAKKNGLSLSHLPSFSALRMPGGITGIFLLVFALSFYFGINTAILNIITIMMWLLAVCGISVLYYYIKKLTKSRTFVCVLLLSFLLSVLSAFGAGVPLVAVLLGTAAVDSFIPLRK